MSKEGPRLTRETYKAVKKFDRQQFDGFCRSLWDQGVEAGKNSVKGFDLEEIYAAIGTVKGIGPKKLAEIREAVNAKYEQSREAGKA